MRNARGRAAVVLLALTACGGGDAAPTASAPRAILAVSLAPSGGLSIGVGDTVRFRAAVSTAPGAPTPVVRWRLSPDAFATIRDDGLLTAVAPGTFSLLAIATTPARNAFRADSLVGTVVVSSLPPAISAFEVEPGALSTPVGGIVRFVPVITPASPAVQVTLSYQLLQNLGSVDATGVITTALPGATTVRIVATGSAPGYQTVSLVRLPTLTVVPTPGITSFEVPPLVTVPVGGTVRVPITLVQPRGALPAAVSAENFTASIATLAGELTDWAVTGLRVGSTTLTFRAFYPSVGGFFSVTRVASTTVQVVSP